MPYAASLLSLELTLPAVVPRRAAMSFEVSPFGEARSRSMIRSENSDIHHSPNWSARIKLVVGPSSKSGVNLVDDGQIQERVACRPHGSPSHSITSSARASSIGGTSRPSALAVVRLMISSNLVGCSTGMSAGLVPRRIRRQSRRRANTTPGSWERRSGRRLRRAPWHYIPPAVVPPWPRCGCGRGWCSRADRPPRKGRRWAP